MVQYRHPLFSVSLNRHQVSLCIYECVSYSNHSSVSLVSGKFKYVVLEHVFFRDKHIKYKGFLNFTKVTVALYY